MGLPPQLGPPPLLGRGGPAPHGGPPPPASFLGRGLGAVSGPYPPVGRFDVGRGGGGGRGFSGGRGMPNGHSGDRRGGGGRGFDSGRGRGGGRGGRHGSSSSGYRDDLDKVSLPKQDFGNLVPFEKNFYVESPAIRSMTETEVRMYRARRDITVEGHDVPKPIRMFEEANFPGSFCHISSY